MPPEDTTASVPTAVMDVTPEAALVSSNEPKEPKGPEEPEAFEATTSDNTMKCDPPLLALTTSTVSSSSEMTSTWTYRRKVIMEERSMGSFAGLSNQGATCYLNSLLQTLYMTPEVRRLLYRFRYQPEKHGQEDRCIPLQLQRLFGRLQLAKERVVSTTDLTKSFGWTARDSFEQHDVQELCRLLFDAVDKFMTHNGDNTDNMDVDRQETEDHHVENRETMLVSDLYTAEMVDYIRSKDDRNEKGELVGRERIDKYMDIQLVIRDVNSVEDALDNYVKPEEMINDNKWFCEELNCKVDAIKGLRFKSPLPYILTLHLKRFDFDYETWRRIKLSNKVSFPFTLDMQRYVSESDDHADADADTDDAVQYELFSTMIHSGSATGGHYYAYIKNFSDGKWSNFNDSNVCQISEEEVEKMFGMDGSAYKNLYASTNAYMLMYRKISPGQNESFPSDEDVPADVRALVALENEQWESERAEWIERNSRITVILNFAEDCNYKPQRVEVRKQHTLEEVKQIMVDQIKENHPDNIQLSGLTVDMIRIRQCKVYDRTPGAEMSGDEMSIESLEWYSLQHVFVEFRSSVDEPWPEIREKLKVYVSVLDPKMNLFHEGLIMELESNTLYDFLSQMTERFKQHLHALTEQYGDIIETVDIEDAILAPENIHLIAHDRKKYTAIDLTDLACSATESGINDTDTLFVEFVSPLSSTVLMQKIEEKENEITLYYVDSGDISSNAGDDLKELAIDKRQTWLHLRQKLAETLGRDIDQFRICDKISKMPRRFDDDQVLSTCGFNDLGNDTLWIENEPPLSDEEFIFKLFRYRLRQGPDSIKDVHGLKNGEPLSKRVKLRSIENGLALPTGVGPSHSRMGPPPPPPPPPPPSPPSRWFSYMTSTKENAISSSYHPFSVTTRSRAKSPFSPLGNMTINKNDTLHEVKLRIAEQTGHPVKRLRLRLKSYNFLEATLACENESMEKNVKSKLQDGTQLAVQFLNYDEQLVEGDLIISVQRWYSSNWKFGKVMELVLNRKKVLDMEGLIQAIATRLSSEESFNGNLSAEMISVAKNPETISRTWTKKARAEVALLDWTSESAIHIWQPPFHLQENDRLFFRDKQERERTSLEALKKAIIPSSYATTGYFNKRTERALKINTIYDDDTLQNPKDNATIEGSIEKVL